MAEMSDQHPRALLSDDPDAPLPDAQAPAEDDWSAQSDEREATELARLRRNYSRASSYHQPEANPTRNSKPANLRERLTRGISTFWRRQISVNVPHDSSRDHLGTSRKLDTSLPAQYLSLQSQHYRNFLFGLGSRPPEK